MTPHEFVLEHWKLYDGYIQRKEHLIEIATTIYLTFVSALLLREPSFWRGYIWSWFSFYGVLILLICTALSVLVFVKAQLHHRDKASRMSNACQTLMTRWVSRRPRKSDLEPVTACDFVGVELPRALVDEMKRRGESVQGSPHEKIWDVAFERAVYVLIILWTAALLTWVIRVWCCQ